MVTRALVRTNGYGLQRRASPREIANRSNRKVQKARAEARPTSAKNLAATGLMVLTGATTGFMAGRMVEKDNKTGEIQTRTIGGVPVDAGVSLGGLITMLIASHVAPGSMIERGAAAVTIGAGVGFVNRLTFAAGRAKADVANAPTESDTAISRLADSIEERLRKNAANT